MSDLNQLHKNLEEDLLPFLGEDETIVEILCSEDSEKLIFILNLLNSEPTRLRSRKVLPSPNITSLAGRQILKITMLELATEIDRRVIDFADNHANDVSDVV